jgi:hypothetical protein
MRIWTIIAIALAGCATTGSGGGSNAPSPFPTRDVLEKIAAAPPPTRLAGDGGVVADGWELTGPLPDTIEPMQYSDGTPLQALLEEAAARRAGQLTMPASMHCVAQETGFFFLAKHALPADRLSHFIAGRCGAVASDVRVAWLDGAVPDGITIGRYVEHYRPQLAEQIERVLGASAGGAQQAGIWFGQKSGHAAVMISVATRRSNLDTMSLVPDEQGRVVIRGEVLGAADHVEAVFNRGHYGFGRCSVDQRILLPRFEVTCPVDAVDANAWIEVAAFPAGRILGHVVANLLVFPNRTPQSAYHDAGYVTRSVKAGADARTQLLALVNEVRHGAGLSEVALAPQESAVAERVAPHYFAAVAGSEPELVADEVVLGLRAGWDVGAEIMGGEFTAGALVNNDDLGNLLDAVLERPSGRETLLGHAARLVAFGPVIAPEQHVIALVATSYSLFDGANHAADAQRVLGRLTKVRVDAQMPPPLRLPSVQSEADDAAARVQRGASSPKEALRRMLQHSAESVPGVGFRGFMFEASSIDDLTFPVELVNRALGGVAISVAHYHPKNGPWWRLVVFILAAAPSNNGQTSAARPAHTL